MKRWLSIFVVVILLASFGGLIGWRLVTKKKADAEQASMRAMRAKMPPVVALAPAQIRDVVRRYEAIGTVETPFTVKIAAKSTGRIIFLQAREGDHVSAGQVLVRLDPSDIDSQLLQRRAALAEAEHRLAQARITQTPTDASVRTQIRQQDAALASAKADLNQTEQNYASQVAAAEADVTDVEGRISSANAAIENAKASIRSAEASLDNAKAAYNRVHSLYQQGFITAQEVDNARTTVTVQEGALAVAQGQLKTAQATLASASAQKQAALRQLAIVKTKGKADIAAARAKVTQSRAALDYARANTAQKPAYRENLNALQADVAAARAAVLNTEALRADTVIRSPIDGYVTARAQDPGTVALPGQALLTVQAMRQVWVSVPVPQDVCRQVRVGQPGKVTFDALPGKHWTAKIIQVNPAADPLSRQFTVRFAVANPQGQIKPGMFARVSLETEHVRAATVVPREAVQQSKDGPTVYVVGADNIAHARVVKLGASDTDGIALTEGITPGEKVVTLSAAKLKDGQEVRLGGEWNGKRKGERREG